jgi:hypothetical protein
MPAPGSCALLLGPGLPWSRAPAPASAGGLEASASPVAAPATSALRTTRAREAGPDGSGPSDDSCAALGASRPPGLLSVAPIALGAPAILVAAGSRMGRRNGTRAVAGPTRHDARQPLRRLDSEKRSERYQARQPLLQIKLARPNLALEPDGCVPDAAPAGIIAVRPRRSEPRRPEVARHRDRVACLDGVG